MNKIIIFAKGIALLLICFSFTSCQASEKNKWTPPKFVKEWEIKEIKPGLPHHIISMTANKNGVFVLVKAEERKESAPKKLNEMTEEDIRQEKFLFGRILTDEERKSRKVARTITNNYYCIQHYGFEGRFIKQWPEGNKLNYSDGIIKKTDLNNYLEKPLLIVSDELGNIYLSDYAGNKAVKFDSGGNVLNLWQIERANALTHEFLSTHKGISISNDKIYLVSEGDVTGSVPNVAEYDLNGKLIREKTVKPPKVPAQMPITGKKIPLLKSEGNVRDMAADKEGNLYLFAGDTTILKLDNQWNEKGYFKTVLEEGFEKPKPVYDPDRQRTINYEDIILKGTGVSFRGFSSDKVSWIENGPGLYYGNKIHLSPDNEILVSFIGNKPFGVIDAMIINRTGKKLGYWKQDKKSYSAWFDKLTDLEKLETADVELDIAFQGNNVFIGRTLKEGTNERKYHTVIQKFTK